MNLARRTPTGRGRKTGTALAKRVELVELIAAPSAPARTTPRYTVRIGQLSIEVGEDFDAGTLRRLVGVLATC